MDCCSIERKGVTKRQHVLGCATFTSTKVASKNNLYKKRFWIQKKKRKKKDNTERQSSSLEPIFQVLALDLGLLRFSFS